MQRLDCSHTWTCRTRGCYGNALVLARVMGVVLYAQVWGLTRRH